MKEGIVMKKLSILLLLLTATAAYASNITPDCTFNGKKLYGKVQIVEHFPDFKVQVVDHFPDISVKYVNNFPCKCGEWQIVDHFPDFKIQIVQAGADIKIKKVDFFPGM